MSKEPQIVNPTQNNNQITKIYQVIIWKYIATRSKIIPERPIGFMYRCFNILKAIPNYNLLVTIGESAKLFVVAWVLHHSTESVPDRIVFSKLQPPPLIRKPTLYHNFPKDVDNKQWAFD